MRMKTIFCYGVRFESFNGKPVGELIQWCCAQVGISHDEKMTFPGFLDLLKEKVCASSAHHITLVEYGSTEFPRYVVAAGSSVVWAESGKAKIVYDPDPEQTTKFWKAFLDEFFRNFGRGCPDPSFLLCVVD